MVEEISLAIFEPLELKTTGMTSVFMRYMYKQRKNTKEIKAPCTLKIEKSKINQQLYLAKLLFAKFR